MRIAMTLTFKYECQSFTVHNYAIIYGMNVTRQCADAFMFGIDCFLILIFKLVFRSSQHMDGIRIPYDSQMHTR